MIYLVPHDSIDKLQFTTRTCNVLHRNGIHTVGALLEYDIDKILDIRNLGLKSYKEILNVIVTLQTRQGEFTYFPSGDIPKDIYNKSKDSALTVKLFRDCNGILAEDIALKDWNLSSRSLNALSRYGFNWVSQLINLDEADILSIPHMGPCCLEEIQRELAHTTFKRYFGHLENAEPSPEVQCNEFVNAICELINIDGTQLFSELLPIYREADEKGIRLDTTTLYKNNYFRGCCKDFILLSLSKYSFGVDRAVFFQKLSPSIFPLPVFHELFAELETSGAISGGSVLHITKMSLQAYADCFLTGKSKAVFLLRLNGATLEETADRVNLSREGVRQYFFKIVRNKAVPLDVDKYIPLFEKYEISKTDFMDVFDEDEMAYNYLRLVCHNSNKLKLRLLLNDESFPEAIRSRFARLLGVPISHI